MATAQKEQREREGISLDIPSFQDVFESLPEGHQTADVAQQLKEVYQREKEIILDRLKKIDEGKGYMGLFDDNTKQPLLNFAVYDWTKEYDPNDVNWHLQNTSQWDYAGGIAVHDYGDDGYKVSSHH